MSADAIDLGEIANLGKALGFLDGAGNVREDWLSRPSHYLSSVMADDTQRDALVAFVDEALGGEDREVDPDGLVWLPIVAHTDPGLTIYLVLDPTSADSTGIGVGVRLRTAEPGSETTAFVPIFRAAKTGHSVASPFLIGQTPSAAIRLSTEIALGTEPPLRGLGLSVRIPTADGADPTLALRLRGLQLPGATAPSDLTVSVDDLDDLDEAALKLVLGLIRAQADALGGDPGGRVLRAVVGLLGLLDDAVAPLPLESFAAQGAGALAGWFEQVVSSTAGRTAWLTHLADLVGGAVAGDEVTFAFGTAQVTLGVRVSTGAGGRPIVTPAIGIGVGSAALRVRAQADLLSLDLATGGARALPGFAAFAQFGHAGDLLLTGDPQVEDVRVGLTLDLARRPTFLLAADGVVINGHTHGTLDLSTPNALADAAGSLVSTAVADLMSQLGPAGAAIQLLIGLTPPPSAPGATTLDVPAFMRDPMGALRAYWRGLLRDHPAGVTDLLGALRELVSDNAAGVVSGAGAAADPWRVPLAGPVGFDVWVDPQDVLHVAVGAAYSGAANLGRRCTQVDTRVLVELARLDLVAPSAVFLPSVEARIGARATRGARRARFDAGPIVLTADHVGARVSWRPDAGLAFDVLAPNLALAIDEVSVPFALPALDTGGRIILDEDGWDALERLAGLLASASPVPWIGELATSLGWLEDEPGPRLRLADLASDARGAIERWLIESALDDRGLVSRALQAVARLLTGSVGEFGHLQGTGTPADPYRLSLLPGAASPLLTAWLGPDGPDQPVSTAPEALQTWRPGTSGLEPGELAAALAAEGARDVLDLLSGRDVATGLHQLVDRWTGTDGRIAPPGADPDGVTVHRVEDATVAQLEAAADLAELFDPPPTTVVRLAVVGAAAPLPWSGVPDERLLDLRAPNREPSSFPIPAGAAGEWFVALADRPSARLLTDDPDGVSGQAARLARVLAAFSDAVVVADAASGHAAIRAAAPANVRALVTLGTPFGPIAFTVLDDQPSADALRLLRALIPPADSDDIDDFVIARGRGLLTALGDLLPLGDPGRELRAPAASVAPAVPVHAFFGVMSRDAILAGMTAVVAAGLASRALARAVTPRQDVTSLHVGIRLPVAASGSGITVGGHSEIEVFGVHGAGLTTDRRLRIHLEVRRANGWLVGGPGIGLGAGERPSEAVRWVEANLGLALGSGAATAEIVLHEASVFGIERERWVIEPSASPLLPEVRVLLSLVADRLEAPAAASPAVDALLEVLRGLDLLAPAGGLVPDAVGHFLFDPDTHVSAALTDATKRARIAAGCGTLLSVVPGVTFDLAVGVLDLHLAGTPGDRGMVHWTADVHATANGAADARITLGSPGTTAAGGAVFVLETSPTARAALSWHRPGATATTIPVWPDPDVAALERAAVQLFPAECLRIAFEYLRSLDETARPVIDTALDAVGLLSATGSVLLPAGLLADPRSWLEHESALGSGFNPARAAALLDSLKPLLGIPGGPGQWQLADGILIRADSAGGDLRLGLGVDTSGLSPIVTPAGRVVLRGDFSLAVRSGGDPAPSFTLSAGLAGTTPGRRAVYAEVGDSVRVYLRPETGADLSLFPDPPGLGQLATTAVTFALPLVLNELASQAGPGLPGDVARVVRAVGDGLGLRVSGSFNAERLQAWAADPAAALSNALPTLTALAMQEMATALGPVLPAGISATTSTGTLRVAAGSSVALTWQPAPFQFECAVGVTGVPGVERLDAAIELDVSGLRSLTLSLGPAAIDAAGVTLRPYVEAVAGEAPSSGRRVEVGLAVDDGLTRLVGGRWNLDPASFSLVTTSGGTVSTDAGDVALALVQAVLDLVAGFAIATEAAQALLANPVGGTTVRGVLQDVVLDSAGTSLDANLFDPARLLRRVQTLAGNLAGAAPSIEVGGGLSIGLGLNGSIVQLMLGVDGRVPLNSGDVVVSIEADSRWIRNQPTAGVAVGFLDRDSFAFTPSLAANGLGLRVSRSSGPLLDAGVTLGSIAVHLFGQIGEGVPLAGGVQVQLSDLAMSPSRAQGGNAVARGLTTDGSSPGPTPQFSPAFAVQKHGPGPVLVSLRAGDGDGPWWLVIQKGFGPIYVEQVGFGVTVREDQIRKISILLDGRVSIFGLTAAVDDLSVTFVVASDASLFDPARWALDLAGLAVSADMSGVVLSGGLRKWGDGENVEYVGMLLARFAVYGLSVYGGYGSAVVNGQRFASFFAFGALNGPIGGPPAFFLTGIGGGLGINRNLIFPEDMSRFGEFPFLKALDPAAQPAADPMAELASLRTFFPMRPGEFWFAAGVSFTSFALVDGIAVVSAKIGDGLEIAILGLARMALPRPQFPLVSIELGLLARFSTREGVLWIQAQLTDNSWLLHESVRLTGGFAFVIWFKGPLAGHFVLTLGGYHPHFHRDGYPQVPRLGLRWSVSDAIVVKGESYFALTSEALMAGGELTATARFGPAWAEVVFGAHGIVFFDPFSFDVEAYARIAAGVTVDLWLGEVTFSISIGARIRVQGPKFYGRATFEVGPVDITVRFGDRPRPEFVPIPWADFVRKYLEEASPGVARAMTAVPGKGALPPGTKSGGTESGTADGSAAKPFEVLSEFELTVTTTVPAQAVTAAWTRPDLPPVPPAPSELLGVAPIGVASAGSTLVLRLTRAGADHIGALERDFTVGGFPVGVWGQPQENDDRKIPQGRIVAAVDGVHFVARATLVGTLPGEVKYHQVETGPRKPLPFAAAGAARGTFVQGADELVGVLPRVDSVDATYAAAKPWLATGGTSRTALAALERDRTAPPRLGSLGEGLTLREPDRPDVELRRPVARPPVDSTVRPPMAIAVLASPVVPETAPRRTTVRAGSGVARVPAPTLARVQSDLLAAIPARLVRLPASGTALEQRTIVATGAVPLTEAARSSTAALAVRGAAPEARQRLASFTSALGSRRGAQPQPQASLRAGEIAVLQMPNARRDVDATARRPRLACRGVARVVALSHGGHALLDAPGTTKGTDVPQGTERVIVLAAGEAKVPPRGLPGWHAGQQLPYLGWSTALAAGCVIRVEGVQLSSSRERFRAGHVLGAELVTGTTIVNTRFVEPARSVAIVLDEPVGAEAARGLTLTLEGAERSTTPPVVVVAGHRSVLVYDLSASRGAFTVSVASQEGWHLAGVIAAPVAAGELAARFVDLGIDQVIQPLVSSRVGSVELAWVEPPQRGVVRGDRIPRRATPRSSRETRTVARKRAPARGATGTKKRTTKKSRKG